MTERRTGLFKCRNCGCIFEEKVDVTQDVNWAIKDITETLGGDGITSVFHGSFLPDRFIIHWCKRIRLASATLSAGRSERRRRTMAMMFALWMPMSC